MRLGKGGTALGGIAVTGALMLTACSSGSNPPPPPSGGKYSVAIEAPTTLTPSNCYETYCANVLSAMFTGILRFQTQNGAVAPQLTGLGKAITTTDQGKTWTIEINPGWKFSNGEAISARTFVDTWNFAAYAPNGQQLGSVFGPNQLNVQGYSDVAPEDENAKPKAKTMSGVKALNDATVQVTLVKPLGQSLFENFLAGPQIYPMPSTAFKDIKAFDKQPIGNGPYKLAGPWSATGVQLIRNTDYSGEPGKADGIEFRIYSDNNTMWTDLQAGTLDVVPFLPQNALANAQQALGNRFINDAGALQVAYLEFPQEAKTFRNKNVRIAIAKAIDWNEINSKLYYDTRQVATSFAPASIPGGGQNVCGDKCTYDPEAAAKTLQAAGGLPGRQVRILALASETQQTEKAICNQLQKNLRIKCSVKALADFQAFYAALGNLEPGDMVASAWVADNPTLQSVISPLFSTGGDGNDTGYSNPKFDKLIEEGNAAQATTEQIAKWQQAEQVAMDDFMVAPAQFMNTVAGYSPNVSNVEVSPQQIANYAEITVGS